MPVLAEPSGVGSEPPVSNSAAIDRSQAPRRCAVQSQTVLRPKILAEGPQRATFMDEAQIADYFAPRESSSRVTATTVRDVLWELLGHGRQSMHWPRFFQNPFRLRVSIAVSSNWACARVIPPCSLIAASPCAPSLPDPESMTHRAFSP